MSRVFNHLIAIALLSLGAVSAQADSRDGRHRDPSARAHTEDRSYDRGRWDRDVPRRHNDARRGYSGRYDHYDRGRDHHRHWQRGRHDRWYPRGDWRSGRYEHGYPRHYRRGHDYGYWRGSGHFNEGSYGDLQVVLNVPLW